MAHVSGTGRADYGRARLALRGCIDHCDDRRGPIARLCECDKSAAGIRVGMEPSILSSRSLAEFAWSRTSVPTGRELRRRSTPSCG